MQTEPRPVLAGAIRTGQRQDGCFLVEKDLSASTQAFWPRDTSVVRDRPNAMCAGHSPATSATAVLHFSAVHSSPTSMVLRGPDSRAPRPTALHRPDPRHVCAAVFTPDTAAQADPVVRRVLSLGGPSLGSLAWRTFAGVISFGEPSPGCLRLPTLLTTHQPSHLTSAGQHHLAGSFPRHFDAT